MRFLWTGLLACYFSTLCQAGLLYTFSYEAIRGPVQSFSFSLTAPAPLTPGTSPTFDPFDVTDGTHTWTLDKGLVDTRPGQWCFIFGSSGASSPPIFPCSSFGVMNFEASFIASFISLPSAPGIYIPFFFGGDFGDGTYFPERIHSYIQDSQIPETGTFTLKIADTSVPEPGTLMLIGFGFSVLLFLYKKRQTARF